MDKMQIRKDISKARSLPRKKNTGRISLLKSLLHEAQNLSDENDRLLIAVI